jgi:hypothetical protein
MVINAPRVVGGHRSFAASQALDRVRTFVWDVNGYYSHLGLPTDATRSQVRDALLACGPNPDAYTTYVTSQLLKADVRRRYDEAPLGSIFLDRYIEEWILDQVRKDMAEHPAEGDDGLSVDDIRALLTDVKDSCLSSVDCQLRTDENEGVQPWGHYVWRTNRSRSMRTARRWRNALAEHFHQRGRMVTLAVGVQGFNTSPWEVFWDRGLLVVFVREDLDPDIDTLHSIFHNITTQHMHQEIPE